MTTEKENTEYGPETTRGLVRDKIKKFAAHPEIKTLEEDRFLKKVDEVLENRSETEHTVPQMGKFAAHPEKPGEKDSEEEEQEEEVTTEYGPENPFIRVALEVGDVDGVAECCYDSLLTPGASTASLWANIPEKSLPGFLSKEGFRDLAKALVRSWHLEPKGHSGDLPRKGNQQLIDVTLLRSIRIMKEEAKGLLDPGDPPGQNPEYERGMCELIARVMQGFGLTSDETCITARVIGKEIGADWK